MTRDEAEKIIREYMPPKPIKYYYNDPYDDGKYCGSGWVYKYPPVSGALIDAILERDKDCKEYIPDSECETDEKFNQEMEKKFTDLMSRAKDAAVEEYRKNNSHLYSMVTENHYDKITIIPMSLSTLDEFKEKCNKANNELGLKNFYVYEHKDSKDLNGKMIYGSGGTYINDSAKIAFSDTLRYCDYFKKHSKESANYEKIKNSCDSIKEHIESLYNMIEADYLQRIKSYANKYKDALGEGK